MISAAFCDELIKISMTPETKQRLKNEAKLLGAVGAGAATAHGVAELARYGVEKKYGPEMAKRISSKAMKGGFPAVAALGTYLSGKAYQHNRQKERKRLGLPT